MIAARPARLAVATAATTAVVAASAGIWLLRRFDPNTRGIFPPCAFHEVTGYWCIGCGITRALHALVHGDVVGAFSMNPLAMTLLALTPLLIGWRLGWQPRWMHPVIAVLSQPKLWLVLLPAYWIARNLPWWPFSMLAPG